MGETERQFENLSFRGGAVTYTDQLHFLAITLRHAYHHVVDEGAVQAVLSTVLAVIGGTGYYYVSVLNLYSEIGIYFLREFALGALYCNEVAVYAGGIGFPILVNFKEAFIEYFRRLWRRINHRTKIGRSVHIWNVNTKIALYTTLIIFAVSTVVFFILERNNTLAGMSLYDSIVQSFFNSTTPRSSGFVSVNPANFLNVTLVIVLFLMWIGGASQSTAGGVKVNTFALILLNLKSIILGKDHVTVYDRTIAVGSIRRANAVVAISIVSYTIYSVILLLLEPQLPAKSVLFETSSALFTVGSSLGITSELGMSSKIVLCTAMFLGRVGIISLLIGVTGNRHDYPVKYPTENIIIN